MITDPTNPWYQRDVGLASENILLAAESVNIGSCILCKIDKNQIRSILHIPDQIEIDSVIALGYKAEISMVEELTNSVQYWRDEKNIMYVPKRKLEDIIHIDGY
jgi:nitroreductase